MAVVIPQKGSSSSANIKHNYDIFLSFRGEDTRKTFTDHLYTALVQAGFHTIRDDDEIERGKKLGLELRKAIQQSRIAIIVFSKNYANSIWCLNEVLMIMEWSTLGGNELVLPIYYDVDPSEVRKQKGSIGEAFAKFEEEFIHNHKISKEKKEEWTQKLNEWRAALEQVSNLTGFVLKNQADGHEAKFIQNIVNVVKSKLNRIRLCIPPHLVGTDYRVRNINRWVIDRSSNAQIFVVCGMGGIGKTTVAKYVYNQNFHTFDESCFVASVKESCERPNGLVKLQRQLLSSIVKGKTHKIYNIDEGIIKVNQALCSKKVFLVLDDIDTTQQLDALLGTRDFYPGSKIILTTRNMSLLKPHELYKIYEIQPLYNSESLELFSWYAFGKEHPDNSFLEKSIRIVEYCGGLPLALKILGSSLSGKSIVVWESALTKLNSIPHVDILDVLYISYDSLQDNHDKNLFLHITCFFVGHDKDETIDILNACGFYTLYGIQNLVDKCLVFIDHYKNKFMMHQLLQEMGRQIVYQESPNEPWRRTRLWDSKDSFTVLKEKKCIDRTEGLIFDMRLYKNDARESRKGRKRLYDELHDTFLPTCRKGMFNLLFREPSSDVFFDCDSFSRMDNLKLLTLNYARVVGSYGNFPRGLIWLCWHGFSFKSIYYDHSHIVSLDLSYSKLEHFQIGGKDLELLKILNLSHSQRLIKISNVRRLVNLGKLVLESCVSLVDLCDTIGDLDKLVFLNLKNCKSLRKFPSIGIRNKCIHSIILDGCMNIVSDLLKVVDAKGDIVVTPPSTCSNSARRLYTYFKPISKIPQPIGKLFPGLVSLSLQNCNLSNDDFLLDLRLLSALRILDLSKNPLVYLPQCITTLSTLSDLKLGYCDQLRELLYLPGLNCLSVIQCSSLERVTFQPTSSKPLIHMTGCKNLIEVQDTYKIEPIDKVNPETLKILGFDDVLLVRHNKLSLKYNTIPPFRDNEETARQMLHEFGILNTFYRHEEVPSWHDDGSYIDSSPSLRFQGLNVHCVYTVFDAKIPGLPFLILKISNITKDLSWIYFPALFANAESEEDELVWLSHWKLGSKVENGDEVHVSAFCSNNLMVKEVSVKIVWGEESYNDNCYTKGIINGDLSDYKFMNKGLFILSHYPFYLEFEFPSQFCEELFGDNVKEEDIREWVRKRWNNNTAVRVMALPITRTTRKDTIRKTSET